MSKNQKERQREQRKIKRREEKLDAKNLFGVSDKVPMDAVNNMMKINHGIRLVTKDGF